MATKKKPTEETTALAVVDEAAALAELSDFFDEVGLDGLEDVGGEDVRLGVFLWNMRPKIRAKDGTPIRKDQFFNTITEEVSDDVECVFLLSTKTKKFDTFDNGLDKTIVHCESRDRIRGTTKEGVDRPCEKCPDDGWFTNPENGKPMRKCGEVHNVVGIERLTQKPFIARFKSTALKPFRTHVMAHHWGARAKDGKRVNVPFFCYAVRITLELHESGKYALPIFELIEQGKKADGSPSYLMPADDVRAYGGHAKDYVEIMGAVLDHAEKQTDTHDTREGGDDGLGAADFADD